METLPKFKPPLPFAPLKSSSPCSISAKTNVVFLRSSSKQFPQMLKLMRPNPASRKIHRNTIVRSEIAKLGSPENESYSITGAEFQLSSKVRAICFYTVTAIAAIPLFAVMVIVHPFVLLFDRYRRRVHHAIAKIWASITIAPFYKFELVGMENLPSWDVPAVFVSNHLSFLDIYTLLTLGRDFKFISKRSVFLFPIVGWAMFLLGTIPLRRMDSRSQLDCLKRGIELVRKGASVFFFPEGTRSKDGKLGSFKKGAFSVAVKTGVPVVPITLMGTGNLMPAGKEGILNSGSVQVVIHKPMIGEKADELCRDARSVIAETLILHGFGVHRNE